MRCLLILLFIFNFRPHKLKKIDQRMFMYPTATPFIQHTAPRGYLRGEDNDRSVFGQQIPGGQITSEKMVGQKFTKY